MNLTILRGTLSRAPEPRELTTGVVVGYDVTIPTDGAKADSVPVVWHDPPASAYRLDRGDEVLVVGCVRRRFFRSAGAVATRTEVVAGTVLKTTQAKRCQTAIDKALAGIAATPAVDVARELEPSSA